jgi:acyl transferase domain-containing protein/NADPH:quinone reductase-like Zn-dependent oxidoreductase
VEVDLSSREVAIVGIGCRLPGNVRTPRELAAFLRKQGDGVVDVPGDRWSSDLHWDPDPQVPGKTHVCRAGFLTDDIFSFDPDPFNISAKEADQLDPQQRLLLEVTWEALEDAGIPVDRLRGANGAVFIGGFTLDHQTLVYQPQNRRLIGSHTAFGSSMTLLSNRLSYTFDLRGPSVTVDTACSSSLVATHLGYEAVARGECDLAIVGGVNVILTPSLMMTMSKAHFLASDGRSKTFDAAADGYGRGEGAAVVVLKPLERALRDGDRVYAAIVATGVNQDGRTPGIAMPSEAAQRSLCERTLRASGLRARDVGYVEAHGTGTRAGDPIEARALGSVYGEGRDDALLVGSIKTNIGHLEAAAGVAGLIKAALSIHHREIFPLRSVDSFNPDIPFRQLNLEVPLAARPWPGEGLARAAVNSFGYGGTNAHAILTEVRPTPGRRASEPPVEPSRRSLHLRVVPISAASRETLVTTAGKLAEVVTDENWQDQTFTLARRRAHLPERAALVVSSAEELRQGLQRIAQDEWADAGLVGRVSGERRVLWVFTGMGPQWWAMGQELYRSEPVFRRAVVDADLAFQAASGWSVLGEMLKQESDSRMTSNAVAQPANFILQVGLVELLRALGVPEHGLLGHSVGEVSAAWAAGCLTLEDAAYVACHRSRLQQRVAGRGTMLAVALAESQLQSFVSPDHDVTVGAYNAPGALTLSGSRADLEDVSRRLAAAGIFNKFVPVEVAYHSPHMAPLESELRSSLGGIAPRKPERPIYSTARGTRLSVASHDQDYWWDNARRPVLLQRALEQAMADGYTGFLEIGPHPVLASSIREVASRQDKESRTWFCLKRGQPEARTVRQAIASLYAGGVALDWVCLYPTGKLVDLPRYSFHRERHWMESSASRESRVGRSERYFSERDDGATLRVECELSRPSLGYLKDHCIQGSVVFPAASYIDHALAACREVDDDRSTYVLDGIRFDRALVLRTDAAPRLRVELDREDGALRISARHGDQSWNVHARCRWLKEATYDSRPRIDLDRLKAEFGDEVPLDDVYGRFDRLGLEYGRAFRGLQSLRYRRDGEGGTSVLARVNVDSEFQALGGVHPVRIDGAFQAMLASAVDLDTAAVPVSAESVRWFRGVGLATWVHGRLGPITPAGLRADVVLIAADGSPVLEVHGLVCRPLERRGSALDRSALFHLDSWRPHEWPAPSSGRSGIWALMGTASGFLESLESRLGLEGIRTYRSDGDARAVKDDCTHLVFAVAPDEADPMGLAACESLRQLVQRLGNVPRTLRVVTFGAHKVEGGDFPNPAQAALWGFGRVIMTELPELGGRLIDLPSEPAPAGQDIVDLLTDDSMPEESAVRGHALFVHRLRRATPAEMSGPRRVVRSSEYDGAFALQAGTAAEPPRLMPRARSELRDVDVEVAVLYPSLSGCGRAERPRASSGSTALDWKAALQPFLRSVVGTVERVGSKVTRFRRGETVHVLQTCEVASHVVAHNRRAIAVLPTHSPSAAVAYGDLFLAWYALIDLARLERGDRVLIGDAEGPFGSACVQVAALRGAQIFATAPEEERSRLRGGPIREVYSSRTLDFVDAIRRETGGRGLDAVVNVSHEPARLKSAKLLNANGTFIELGAWYDESEGVASPRLRGGQRFIVADLNSLAELRPDSYESLTTRVLAALQGGHLVLPTVQAIGFQRASGGSHAPEGNGRLAVELRSDDATVDIAEIAHRPRPDRTYLITGGLGGFGLATAQWLVEQGARSLVLASRRGRPDREAVDAVRRLVSTGARVECRMLDVGDKCSIDELLAFVRSELPPLGGIFHSATVFDDQPLKDLSAGSLRSVMTAKALGAWLLYEKTKEAKLQHFVLYSSVSGLVGNPNQAAYAAANAALDSLAILCRTEGVAATCIAWGAIDDVGVVAGHQATRAHLQALGVAPIPVRPALDALHRVLQSERPWVGVIDVQWGRWMQSFPKTPWTRLAELRTDEEDVQVAGALDLLRRELAAMTVAARKERVLALVRGTASKVLGGNHVLHDGSPLSDYGFDSLMAVDFQRAVETACGVSIPVIQLLAKSSLSDVAERILEALSGPQPMAERLPESTQREENLREVLLSRICVQPPYFQLLDVTRDGEWIEALVRPVPPSEHEADFISCAEEARHLAIVGSCAVSLKSRIGGRVYYPVRRAYAAQVRGESFESQSSTSGILDVARVRARCISFDSAASTATAECDLLDGEGNELSKLIVDYHVIPANEFERLFSAHAESTNEESGLDPYELDLAPAVRTLGDNVLSMDIGPVEPSSCLGHFVGYPALPLSILTRHAVALIAAGVRETSGPNSAITVLGGWVEAHSFLFAHERATMTAELRSGGGDGRKQVWFCEVKRQTSRIATFELMVRPAQRRVSEVRAIREVRRTA